MIFETKKIQIETLSEYLSSVRQNLNMPLDEVSKKTNISIKFLNSLEIGDFKKLPADVYVYGFLRQLSDLYLVDKNELIKQYKKERGIVQQISKVDDTNITWKNKFLKKMVVTPKILSFIMGATFVLASIIYIIWQVWSINRTPSLEILKPENNSVISNSFVQIIGKTDPGMNVTVNDQIVFVDNNGSFQTQLGLSPGPKEITITAKNRFDKSFSKVLNITGSAITEKVVGIQLKADFTSSVTLNFSIDDMPTQALSFNSGDSKVFIANKNIIISTTNAGATRITLNGQNLGAMGRDGETINNVSFFAQEKPVIDVENK